MEVFPFALARTSAISSLLHVRGGVSTPIASSTCSRLSSPRRWRCFQYCQSILVQLQVFSTYVEVFPVELHALVTRRGLLHVRGGVSGYIDIPLSNA